MNILNLFKNNNKVYFSLFEKNISVVTKDGVAKEYADKCIEHLNNLSEKMIDKLCDASRQYYKEHLDEANNCNIEGKEILKHISPKLMIIDKPQSMKIYYEHDTTETKLDYKIGYHIELSCDLGKKYELEWTINENSVLYVGKFSNENAWKSDEYYSEMLYNYVNKTNIVDQKNDNSEIDEEKLVKLEEVINEYKKLTEKECYSVSLIEEEPGILDNKIGGIPYIPVGEEYPIDKSGNPMELLLQINLNDIQLEGWPKAGILEIFISLEEDDYEYSCTVKLFEENLQYQTAFSELPIQYPIIKQGYKIKLTKDVCYMPIDDDRFKNTLWPIIEKVYNIKGNDLTPLYKIFGTTKWDEKFASSINIQPITIGGYQQFVDTPLYDDDYNKTDILFKLDPLVKPNNFYMINDKIINVIVHKKSDDLMLNLNDVNINY